MYMIIVTNNGNVNNNHIYIYLHIYINLYITVDWRYIIWIITDLGPTRLSLATITAANISGFDVKCQYTVHKHNNMYVCIIYV